MYGPLLHLDPYIFPPSSSTPNVNLRKVIINNRGSFLKHCCYLDKVLTRKILVEDLNSPQQNEKRAASFIVTPEALIRCNSRQLGFYKSNILNEKSLNKLFL